MSELKNYLLGDYRETIDYVDKVSRYGLTKFAPLIISCAITGGVHGKESNPNLPETIEEQVQQSYDVYNAGASLIHIHVRDKNNLAVNTPKTEDYLEVNSLVREKCPEVIINNTCLGGRMLKPDGSASPQLLVSIGAKPEVASVDIASFSSTLKLAARKPPLSGRDNDETWDVSYLMTMGDAARTVELMNENGVKPELEMYDITNIKYISNLINKGLLKGPHWVQMIFNGTGIYPSVENMLSVTRLLPKDSLFSVIGIGAAQTAMITLAIALGHHVRVGLEDNVFYGPHQLATSNAQMVERVVRIAKELGRPIATPAQSREMLGLGAPRQYTYNK
ncbi:3-keto-5-aminohexanoate cleavage protein [Sporomusa termitida]|uniref:3-keto-5-aminohexanoate cleavage enzyme n=1 Tax=Sporomusa termitida TaxID=2377 RepID=A0A517DSD8_9FIRM|nr:3-keto-5-aminohexanoate cleavage protein [Sporomusa termitida]QDR80274.1 3-keto-5-aminohexanoate cleavage enzyme [Sporomusa termitida]